MNKINIFWIEDNPIQENFNKINGIRVPSFEITLSEKNDLFSFKLFQHPMEVYEYLSMISELNGNGFSNSLAEHSPRALPDIVVFDYRMSDNFSTNNPNALQYSNTIQYTFLKEHSVSLNLKEDFDNLFGNKELFIERIDIKEGNYNSDEFRNALCAKNISNIDDEFGLYSGIAIIREFKNFITLGVPATLNKPTKSALSENSLFYEWLNSYDIKDAIERPDKEGKNWNDILKFALPLLKKRIKGLIQSLKITPSLSQLIDITGGSFYERIFTFNSIYGKRELPIDGLFIDEPAEARDAAMVLFAKECLDLHLNNANTGLSRGVLDEAIKLCNELLKQYDNKDQFLERVRYSQLEQKLKNGSITPIQQTELDAIYLRKGMSKSDKEYKDSFDLRNYTGAHSNLVKRYATLFVMVNIYHRFVEFKKNHADKIEFKGKPYLFTQPEKIDYLLAIYPRPSTPLILPLHGPSDGHDNDLKRTTKRVSSDDIGILINSVLNQSESGGITKGEKLLLQSYSIGIGLDKENFADWFI